MDERQGPAQMVPRPAWLAAFERDIAARIAVHPNAISAGKLLVVTPLLLLSLRQLEVLPGGALLVSAGFAARNRYHLMSCPLVRD